MTRLTIAVLLAAGLALLGGCAHDTSLKARVAGAERLVGEAEERLEAASGLIEGGEDLDRAGDLLEEARERAEDPGTVYYADRENLLDRLAQADARLEAARDTKLRREIAAQVPERKGQATERLLEFRQAADLLQDRVKLDRARVERARRALVEASGFLDDSQRFEIDAGWASFAAGVRKELGGRTVQVELAEALMAFREGPVERNAEARKLFEESKGTKGEDRASRLGRAREAWLACGKEADELVEKTPTLAREPLYLPEAKTTIKSFTAACHAQAKSVEGLLAAPEKPAKAAPKKPAPKKGTGKGKGKAKRR